MVISAQRDTERRLLAGHSPEECRTPTESDPIAYTAGGTPFIAETRSCGHCSRSSSCTISAPVAAITTVGASGLPEEIVGAIRKGAVWGMDPRTTAKQDQAGTAATLSDLDLRLLGTASRFRRAKLES